MFELNFLSENCGYIQSPAKIGLYKVDENSVIFIDSGNDKDAGRKLRQLLDANKWRLSAIFCTHSHADHIGGCQYLQKQTDCKVYAPGIECDFTRHPILEPTFLNGARPYKELKNKFLMAQSCDCAELTEAALPDGLSMIALPGHSYDQVGFKTEDGVIYLADALSGRETLEKYRIAFLSDVEAYLETLEMIKTMEGRVFVPSHAEATEDIAPLAQYNIDVVQEIAGRILGHCALPLSFEALLAKLFEDYQLSMTVQQHALVGSTVRSYLSWLKDRGELHIIIEDNMLLWGKK